MRFTFLIFLSFSITILSSCAIEPDKLVYGTDACHFCKMTLVDNKFGAELVTKKGKIYKFDDFVCFLNFYNADPESQSEYAFKLVVNYANPGELINATDGLYVKSSAIKSPMAGNISAFSNKKELDEYNKNWKGIYLSWGEVVTEFK